MTPDPQLTRAQAREVRRLRAGGLSEEDAVRLATDPIRFDVALPPPDDAPAQDPEPELAARAGGRYADVDSDDTFMDLPEPQYEGNPDTSKRVDDLLARAKRGEVELPALPRPPDR